MPGNRGQAEEQGLERVEAHELVPVVGLDEKKDDRRDPQVGKRCGQIALQASRLPSCPSARTTRRGQGRSLAAGRTEHGRIAHLLAATFAESRHRIPRAIGVQRR